MDFKVSWIKPNLDLDEEVPVFQKKFVVREKAVSSILNLTALGVYEATLNGKRVGEFVLAPGWTAYHRRLQYQTYDVKELLCEGENTLEVLVGKGWYRGRMECFRTCPQQQEYMKNPEALCASLSILYENGQKEEIVSDESWTWSESQVRSSQIYDGEVYDASYVPVFSHHAERFDGPTHTLIPQEGEEVRRQERIVPCKIFTTPKGETVVDFGQEVTGYVETSLEAAAGEAVDLSFAEVLDRDGNFYTENYRTAKAKYHYTCKDGFQTYTPKLTFWGFRYIRVNQFPGQVKKENFCAVVLHSDMKRTGYISCADPMLNQLFSNIIWGQKGNFVDVPTDCPQRDERLGWTGDAQVFCKTACLNYDAEKFFTKWLRDLAAEQKEDGLLSHVIPATMDNSASSPAWGDAAVICPWQVYLAYGNRKVLENQFESMKKWVAYIGKATTVEYLWTGNNKEAFGDWLALDMPEGEYSGKTDRDLIGSAFYANAVQLVIKAGCVLGEDVEEYERLYPKIVQKFREVYPTYPTQTACVLAVYFHLAEDCKKTADQLAEMVKKAGHLETGFVGTPYLLHVLSDYGYTDLAYTLLLRKEYPSWLYPITKGATTIWEHWDGIREDGTFWSADMNSYNHYAYGSVADWIYTVAAGIQTREDNPGYEKVTIYPHPDARIPWLKVRLCTRHGEILSAWKKTENGWQYEIETPVEAIVQIGEEKRTVNPGKYRFYSPVV